jgi:hypothetical protein
MNRPKSKNIPTRTDPALGTSVVAAGLLLVGLIVLRNKAVHSLPPPRCPIDGIAADWRTDQRGSRICTTDISAKSTRNLTLGGRLASEIFWTTPITHAAPGQAHVILPRWGAAVPSSAQGKSAPLPGESTACGAVRRYAGRVQNARHGRRPLQLHAGSTLQWVVAVRLMCCGKLCLAGVEESQMWRLVPRSYFP